MDYYGELHNYHFFYAFRSFNCYIETNSNLTVNTKAEKQSNKNAFKFQILIVFDIALQISFTIVQFTRVTFCLAMM